MGKPAIISPLRAGHRLAAGIGLCLLVTSGAGYQWLAARYARASQSVPIPAGTLSRLPLSIGDWNGRDVALDERVIRATDTDDHLNRVYTQPTARQNVALWVAYGVRFRDLMPHRPEVCYPGAGWTLEETRKLELRTTGGSPLPCRILRFSRGALRNERITVLNFYLVDGQYSPDVSALRDRTWRLKSNLQYVAQVQIACGDVLFQANAEKAVSDFAADSADSIRGLLAEAVSKATGRTVAAAD
jgi:EpsI family protein